MRGDILASGGKSASFPVSSTKVSQADWDRIFGSAKQRWTSPEFEEIALNAEINSYAKPTLEETNAP